MYKWEILEAYVVELPGVEQFLIGAPRDMKYLEKECYFEHMYIPNSFFGNKHLLVEWPWIIN